jgi:hypothetical protein
MQIDVSQLRVGDEFLYAAGGGSLARAKVLRPPMQRKQTPRYAIVGKTYYKALKCKVSIKETVYTATYSNRTYTYKKREYFTSDEFNNEKYIDLNGKTVWLIKREKHEN